MTKPPPIHELDFLKQVPNHAEFTRRLGTLGIPATDIGDYAKHVAMRWLTLGMEHLDEANHAHKAKIVRTAYSRAYYAAYNASKAARYLVHGGVSLKGDDHASASADLPKDFPDLPSWSQKLVTLYKHRLRADYDNWSDTVANQSISPADAIAAASEFVDEVQKYLLDKFGVKP